MRRRRSVKPFFRFAKISSISLLTVNWPTRKSSALKSRVNERDIDKTIERMKEARSFTDEQLREGLARQGMTMAEYRKEIKEQILRTKLVNREVKSKIVITKEDIKAYYDSHLDEYAGEKKYYLL